MTEQLTPNLPHNYLLPFPIFSIHQHHCVLPLLPYVQPSHILPVVRVSMTHCKELKMHFECRFTGLLQKGTTVIADLHRPYTIHNVQYLIALPIAM